MRRHHTRSLLVAVVLAAVGMFIGVMDPARERELEQPPAAGGGPAPVRGTTGPLRPDSTPLPRITAAEPEAATEDRGSPEWQQFQSEVVALHRACSANPPCDERKLQLEQAGLGFDHWLGYRHPRRAQLLEIVGRSFDDRMALQVRFEGGAITRSEMFAVLREQIGAAFRGFAAILSDEDWQRIFTVRKGENPAALFQITSEKALALDQEDARMANRSPVE